MELNKEVENKIAELEAQINQREREIEELKQELLTLQVDASGYNVGDFVIYFTRTTSSFFGPDKNLYSIMKLDEIVERTEDGEICFHVYLYDYEFSDIEKVKSSFLKDYNAGVARSLSSCYMETDRFLERFPVKRVKQKFED